MKSAMESADQTRARFLRIIKADIQWWRENAASAMDLSLVSWAHEMVMMLEVRAAVLERDIEREASLK